MKYLNARNYVLLIFDTALVCLIVTTLFYGISQMQNRELAIRSDDAIERVQDYMYGSSINLDGLMFDLGYYPANRIGGVASWVNNSSHIWIEFDEKGNAIAVFSEAGFDRGVWDAPLDGELCYYYVDVNSNHKSVPISIIAALLGAATGDTTGFRAV